MGLNDTVSADRVRIAIFGARNAGKSSLINAITGQGVSVVSETAGTTTDPVRKTMELLPLGACEIIDTAGIDDFGELGEKRVAQTKKILRGTDIAILVRDVKKGPAEEENELLGEIKRLGIPHITVYNKADTLSEIPEARENEIYVSAKEGKNITELKNLLGSFARAEKRRIIGDLIERGDTVLLITPIDAAAPKGRLILPQQQTLRDVLDSGAIPILCRETEIDDALSSLAKEPRIAVCDSQVFHIADKKVPKNIPLTSFSLLFARYKGNFKVLLEGASAIDGLCEGDRVLICEACTHHRTCQDIGTVKIPNLLRRYTGVSPQFEFTSGGDFPSDLSKYALIIHCGGCMINDREMSRRVNDARNAGIPVVNYGMAIAHMRGILSRASACFEK